MANQKLAEIIDSGNGYHYQGSALPLEKVNVLAQPRRTFEHISELAIDIAHKGLCNPMTVAKLNSREAKEYLKVINKLWRTSYKLKELVIYQDCYHILIAGERRYRACCEIRERGCPDCQEQFGERAAQKCFKKHFPSGQVEVRLCCNISAMSAIFLQFSENTHIQVPIWEEAKAYEQLFGLIREVKPEFSVSKFSRLVGRNAETIGKALKFCQLPGEIQEAVKVKFIHYGIAVELARLKEGGVSNEELIVWLNLAIAGNKKVDDFRQQINDYLAEKNSGQQNLLESFSAEQQKQEWLAHFRQVVGQNIIMAVWQDQHYLRKMLSLFEQGKLGKADSPFSCRSPLKVFRTFVELCLKVSQHLKKIMPEAERQTQRRQLQKTLRQVDKAIAESTSEDKFASLNLI